MSKKIWLLALLILSVLTLNLQSQTETIILQPNAEKGKDASVRSYWPDANINSHYKFYIHA